MKYFKKNLLNILILSLFSFTFIVGRFLYINDHHGEVLKVVFLDVGQGDSIFIEAPNGKQMLIDGGPDASVLARLSSVMPFGDRSIDLILITHADMDHIGGLYPVLENYKVGRIIENGLKGETNAYKNLESKIIENKIERIIAHRGMNILLDEDKNIYFNILFPDRDVSLLESNDGSIVGKLIYGDNSFMMMGDASTYTENLIKWNESKEFLHSQILKLGHHGSHTSNNIVWLEAVNPDIAIISVGEDNRYGHPHKDILDKLDSLNIPYLFTYEKGNILFEVNEKDIIQK